MKRVPALLLYGLQIRVRLHQFGHHCKMPFLTSKMKWAILAILLDVFGLQIRSRLDQAVHLIDFVVMCGIQQCFSQLVADFGLERHDLHLLLRFLLDLVVGFRFTFGILAILRGPSRNRFIFGLLVLLLGPSRKRFKFGLLAILLGPSRNRLRFGTLVLLLGPSRNRCTCGLLALLVGLLRSRFTFGLLALLVGLSRKRFTFGLHGLVR
mmetsp:Transcript_114268/g.363198  ORF Transcript_114268/g.363198 Transcript_114268/m.363198 type:complete len:209 (-) Transcript_114268:1329-1955(-)